MDGTYKQPTASEASLSLSEKLLARALRRLEIGTLHVTFPSGAQTVFSGSARPHEASADICFASWRSISRILRRGALGLAEGYMEQDWTTTDIRSLMLLFGANMDALESKLPRIPGVKLLDKIGHFANRNNKQGSRKNISYHYDLGNDFYDLWLDSTMTYSAALFDKEARTLEEAQIRKYARLAEAVGIKAGDRVLEIGCGWGGFADYAVNRLGCEVVGVTLSTEQLAYAQQRLAKTPNHEKATFILCDYRDVEGEFDHIVSIEMLEAVGAEYWNTYFSKVRSLLKPGGRAGIQVITIDNERFERYRTGVDFIQKYIFPGGMLPSDQKFKDHVARADMTLEDQLAFGIDYAETLRCWYERFNKVLPQVSAQGYDDRFVRMWNYYLVYCEAGFRHKSIDVSHYVIQR